MLAFLVSATSSYPETYPVGQRASTDAQGDCARASPLPRRDVGKPHTAIAARQDVNASPSLGRPRAVDHSAHNCGPLLTDTAAMSSNTKPALPPQIERFVAEYLADGNAAAAAARAGYSQATAKQQGSRLLKRPDVIEALCEHRQRLAQQQAQSLERRFVAEYVRCRVASEAARCELRGTQLAGSWLPTAEAPSGSGAPRSGAAHLGHGLSRGDRSGSSPGGSAAVGRARGLTRGRQAGPHPAREGGGGGDSACLGAAHKLGLELVRQC